MSVNRSKLGNTSKSRGQEKLTSIINKKKLRSHLDKVISDFSILPKKREPSIVVKHVLKTIFWATVYLAFSYLTITSTFEVIRQYHDEETKTNVIASINNKVTHLPNMTVCLKINPSELFNNSLSSSLNYMSAWSQFFEETISPEGIFKVNESQVYDDEIYLSLLKYLAMIYEAERAWEPGLTQISTFHSEESDDWIALKKVLVPNIERYNISLEQLKRLLDEKFCSLPVYNSNYFSNSDYAYIGSYGHLLDLSYGECVERKCIIRRKISFIGMDTICFRLIGYQYFLRSIGTTKSFFLRPYEDNNQKWCQEFTIDLGSESRSTPRRAMTQYETFAYYYKRISFNTDKTMDIGIKALYRKLPYVKGEVQCSSDTNREECENKCLRRWIRANCDCSPITFNLTADKSSYRSCTVDDYTICLNNYTENATSLCTKKCVPLCEQWHYDVRSTSNEKKKTHNYGVKISIKTFDYVTIEQVFSWPSFEEFIGALGGALGIWLGLDFVIVMEFIVKLVTRLIKKILMRNGQNSEEDKHRKSANIKHREENVENGTLSSNEMESCVTGHQKNDEENESEIAGTSIHQINESEIVGTSICQKYENEKQRTSRKKRESNAFKEKKVQQRRRRSNNNRVNSAISDDKMKNDDVQNGRPRNHKMSITDNVDTIQHESATQDNHSSAQSWFLQKILFLLLNGDASTNKLVLCLRLVENLFWTAIYIVGSVFTTLWCVQLINSYLAEEAVYFPTLIINRTVSLPPPSLCILHDVAYTGINNNFSYSLIDYFNQSNIDKASFLQISEENTWPKPLVIIGIIYFNVLTSSEIGYNFTSYYESQHDFLLRKL